jgi:hypothetical protein
MRPRAQLDLQPDMTSKSSSPKKDRICGGSSVSTEMLYSLKKVSEYTKPIVVNQTLVSHRRLQPS